MPESSNVIDNLHEQFEVTDEELMLLNANDEKKVRSTVINEVANSKLIHFIGCNFNRCRSIKRPHTRTTFLVAEG